jgi:uncharacterized membrane protein YgcG
MSHTIIGLEVIFINGQCFVEEGGPMKAVSVAVVILAGILGGAGCVTGRYTQYPGERVQGSRSRTVDSLAVMSTRDVIAMTKAGAGDDVILDLMKRSGSAFQLRARDVVELADSGVSDRVIRAMIRSGDAEEAGESGEGSLQATYWNGQYWYGGYPYYYPWYFGLSFGYYSPFFYSRGFGLPRYGTFAHRGSFGGHRIYAGHGFSGGSGFSGGRGSGGMRSSGRRR